MALPRRRRLAMFLALALAGSVLSVLAMTSPARAITGSSGSATVTVTPDTNLADLTSVHVHAVADVGHAVFSVHTRICKPGAGIVFPAQFTPDKGNCAANPMSAGASSDVGPVPSPPPNTTADLDFTAGIGQDVWQVTNGTYTTLVCDSANPCDLVTQLEVDSGTEFFTAPLTFNAVAPPHAPGQTGTPVAVAGDQSATVTWTAPSFTGGSPITGYTVTANPGGATCTWVSGPLSCTYPQVLTNGTPYTFKVKATNAVGPGPDSLPSNTVTPQAGAITGFTFHPLAPVRVLDSRGTVGGWASSKLVAGTPRDLTVGGINGVPAGAAAVVMNVTVTNGTQASFVTAYPSGTSTPNASNLNFAANQTIPNLVTVKLGTGGGADKVTFANANGATDVVADLVGYYDSTAGDRFNPMNPARILDSRGAVGGWAGTRLNAGTPRSLTVAGVAGIPASADAVIMNVTVTNGTQASFVTAYPTGQAVPNASNVNFAAFETIPNLVTVKLGTGINAGKVNFANANGSVDVIADVVGYYDATTGDYFHPLAPARILDSRGAVGGWASSKLVAGTPRLLQVSGNGGVPAGATSVVANTTVTNGTQPSFLTAFPGGAAVPNASNLNFAANQTIPNLVAVKLGSGPTYGGQVGFANANGATDVIFDVVGYFAAT